MDGSDRVVDDIVAAHFEVGGLQRFEVEAPVAFGGGKCCRPDAEGSSSLTNERPFGLAGDERYGRCPTRSGLLPYRR